MKSSRVSRRTKRRWLRLFTVFLMILAVSFALMAFADTGRKNSGAMLYIAGGLFWAGLIGTVVMILVINIARIRDRSFKKKYDLTMLIRWFSNKWAVWNDLALIASVIMMIIARILIDKTEVFLIIFAVFIFSFGMHFMLNGINYKYINYKGKRGRQNESNKK